MANLNQQMIMSREEIAEARQLWRKRFVDDTGEVSVRKLAQKYGVSKTTMHKILTGERG